LMRLHLPASEVFTGRKLVSLFLRMRL